MTFGYKSRFNGPLRALTAIAIGVVMIVSKANALNLAVRIIAAFLVASGVVSFIVGYKNRENGTMGLMGFNAIVDIVLGTLVFLWPGVVAGLIIYLIAFALIAFGFFQLISLGSANKVVKVGLPAFILPVLVLVSGVFLLFKPSFVGEAIGVIAGAALVLYGVSELYSSWKMRKAIEQDEQVVDVQDVKDVDFEPVDEQEIDEQEIDEQKVDEQEIDEQ